MDFPYKDIPYKLPAPIGTQSPCALLLVYVYTYTNLNVQTKKRIPS